MFPVGFEFNSAASFWASFWLYQFVLARQDSETGERLYK